MLKPVSRLLHTLLFAIFIGTLAGIVYYLRQEPDITTVRAVASTPTATLPNTVKTIQDSGWSLVQSGLERRVIDLFDEQSQPLEALHIWRLEQAYFRLDVAYAETPRSLDAWQKQTNAALVVNGGYYSIENESFSPDGLTISNGQASGSSFAGFGGMLAVKEDGAELRWLVEQPYDPAEPLQAALQSFPILVQPGGKLGFGAERENNVPARRTVIAQDKSGRILFIVAPQGYFTLHQLSLYLTTSDLNLEIAVNLDGGGSTGLLVANPREIVSSARPLPFVILVYPR